jgi:hypothetical protein
MPALFRAAILLNAFLLFLVQPMFAKMALPLLGGSPAVWTTCMLFFQAALLLGYLYSHLSTQLLGVRRQVILHCLLLILPLLLLPVGIAGDTRPPAVAAPAGWLLVLMAGSIGLPFLMLSTTAPLLQRWFAVAGSRPGADPYFLYGASNAGSLAGLLLYPAVIEPLLPLRLQQEWWSAGYILTAALLVGCAALTFRAAGIENVNPAVRSEAPPSTGLRVRWILLAAVPSGLMLAVTFHISTDIAAVPLLWVVPLALYLSTFIIVFSAAAAPVVAAARRALPLVLLPLVLLLIAQVSAHLWFVIPLHLAAFWLLSLLCHAELARTRPAPSHLTEFYVWLAAGGMAGGFFNTFVAPGLFVSVGEYPLLIAAACLLMAEPAAFRDLAAKRRLAVLPVLGGAIAATVLAVGAMFYAPSEMLLPFLGIAAVLCFAVSRHAASFALGIALLLAAGTLSSNRAWGDVLYTERTFFGVYRIASAAEGRLVSLFHGTTLHGSQLAEQRAAPEPLSYYHRGSPIGDVFAALHDRPAQSVGAVGLGVAALAAYVRPGQSWTFYEIDPTVERIARDARYFTFLETCGSTCRVVIGDGRLSIRFSAEKHDIIVLDAFSSDAIPVHLLTREAIDEYLGTLRDDGVLAFHISNRHFDLEPVLSRVAADRGLISFVRQAAIAGAQELGHLASRWVVMTRNAEVLSPLASDPNWKTTATDGKRVWTDDFSNVWSALELR